MPSVVSGIIKKRVTSLINSWLTFLAVHKYTDRKYHIGVYIHRRPSQRPLQEGQIDQSTHWLGCLPKKNTPSQPSRWTKGMESHKICGHM